MLATLTAEEERRQGLVCSYITQLTGSPQQDFEIHETSSPLFFDT